MVFMYSIYEEITEQIKAQPLNNAIKKAVSAGELPEADIPDIMLEKPREGSLRRLINKPGDADGKTGENGTRQIAQSNPKAYRY